MNTRLRLTLVLTVVIITASVSARNKNTLVVMNFKSANTSGEFSVAVSEMLRGILTAVDQKEFILVERENLNNILKEKELSLTGILDAEESRNIGKIMAADFMIVGSVSQIGSNYSISARLIDIENGSVIRGTTVIAQGESEIGEKLSGLALVLMGMKKLGLDSLEMRNSTDGNFATGKKTYHYNSWFTDNKGTHKGGKIIMTIHNGTVTGRSIESFGTATMTGQVAGDRIVGYYKASYGYGNFEFNIRKNGNFLEGTYYQVSNGAKGSWVGKLVKIEK